MADRATPVVIADDESDVRLLLRLVLEVEGFDVVCEAANGREAVACLAQLDPAGGPAVFVLDNRMPVLLGIDAAEQILTQSPEQLVVLFTADFDPSLTGRARRAGVAACVEKTKASELPAILRELLAA